MSELRVILLDPYNQHPPIQSELGPRIQYYNDQNTCIDDIQNEMNGCKQIDLFLSSENRHIIENILPLYRKVCFHLYCSTDDDISTCKRLYPSQGYVSIFRKDYLWAQISHKVLAHDMQRLIGTNYSLEAFEAWQLTHRIVLREVQAAKIGIQPA